MYYISGTDERCYIGAGRCFVFIRQVAALFYVNWRDGKAAILKV